MTEQFPNKTVMVTGATRGIGHAIATRFLEQSARVIGVYRRSDEEAHKLEAAYGPNFLPVKFDLRDIEKIGQMVCTLPESFSAIDILVNNAGIKQRTSFFDTNPDVWNETITTNLAAPYFLTQAVARGMTQRRNGRVINVTSQADPNLSTESLEYGLSKSGLAHFTKVAARLLAPSGITVNAVSPGRTFTDLTNYSTDSAKAEAALKNIPLGHINDPDEVADVVLFLAGSTNITGQILAIDGGEVIR